MTLEKNLFLGLGACMLAIVILIWWVVVAEGKREQAFMADCMQERKAYECAAMWRAGESHTTVVPMPVVVGR